MPGTRAGLEARLWRGVDKSAGLWGCWIWRGHVIHPGPARSGGAYGRIQVARRGSPRIYVHRLALVLATGENPPELEACHAVTCTTSLCCNPSHLRWDTRAANLADWIAKYGTRTPVQVAMDRVWTEEEEGGTTHVLRL